MFDPLAEARKVALNVRELYDAFIFAGFSKEESFELIKTMLANPPRS